MSKWMFKRFLGGWLGAMLLCAVSPLAQASEIYGYVDEQGVTHFSTQKEDDRYELYFRDGQNFESVDGQTVPLGAVAPTPSLISTPVVIAPKPARGPVKGLMAAFETAPGHQSARTALRNAARLFALDYELLKAVIATESGFNTEAVSPKGAIGLMQIMPATAQRYGVQPDRLVTIEAKLADPSINISTGARYLRDLMARFSGRIELALAAYNAGEGAVQRAGNRVPDYPETQNYVKKVLELYAQLKPWDKVLSDKASGSGRVHMELGGAIGPGGRGNLPSARAAGR